MSKVFRVPKPKIGIKRGYKHPKRIRGGVYNRKLKKKILAKEIAIRRWKDKVIENALQPQPKPVDINGIPEEIKFCNDLKSAYRINDHYQKEAMDPTPYITDQYEGEQWYLNKMKKLNDYQENRKKWKSFLNSTSLDSRMIGHNLNKLPNNQAPVTQFWNKQTVDWLSDNRWKLLHRHGMHGRHLTKYFKKYDRCNIHRDWPAHNEVIEMYEKHKKLNNGKSGK